MTMIARAVDRDWDDKKDWEKDQAVDENYNGRKGPKFGRYRGDDDCEPGSDDPACDTRM